MSDTTKIEWTNTYHEDGSVTAGSTWNPIRGTAGRHTCARISPGCGNCYAATMNKRGLGGTAPLDYGQGETLNDPARLDEKALLQPFHWKKPRQIFVGSMTDLFGTWLPDEWIDRIFGVMALTPWHTYILLTKRPTRMRDYMTSPILGPWAGRATVIGDDNIERPMSGVHFRMNGVICEMFKVTPAQVLNRASAWQAERYGDDIDGFMPEWPLPNVWVGTTIESDQFAWRADRLRQTPAAVRWISAEPLLSGLPSLDLTGIDWLVAGGESGHGARPMHPDWARDLRDRCTAAGTAYFFKQWGAWAPTQVVPGGDLGGDLRRGTTVHMHAPGNPEGFFRAGDVYMSRLGNHKTGRLLDGREWNELPPVAAGAAS